MLLISVSFWNLPKPWGQPRSREGPTRNVRQHIDGLQFKNSYHPFRYMSSELKNNQIVRPVEIRPVESSLTPEHGHGSQWTRAWIPLGAGLFIFALVGSAVVIPRLRLLHAFQALIYVAVVLLARRDSALGFGAGITIAVAWNSLEWLGPHLIQAGAHEVWTFLSTGRIRRPDTLMVFIGGIAHISLIVACLAAFRQLHPGKKEWWHFLTGGALVLAYFAVIVATLLPH